jgi:hypothetical protein
MNWKIWPILFANIVSAAPPPQREHRNDDRRNPLLTSVIAPPRLCLQLRLGKSGPQALPQAGPLPSSREYFRFLRFCACVSPSAQHVPNASTLCHMSVSRRHFLMEIPSAITTYCPYATEIVHGAKTYTVSSATTLTITDCPCTLTYPIWTSTTTSCSLVVNHLRRKIISNIFALGQALPQAGQLLHQLLPPPPPPFTPPLRTSQPPPLWSVPTLVPPPPTWSVVLSPVSSVLLPCSCKGLDGIQVAGKG